MWQRLKKGMTTLSKLKTEDQNGSSTRWFIIESARDLEKTGEIKGVERRDASVTNQVKGEMKKRKPRK